MKVLVLIFCLWSANAVAAAYKLDDPKILGKYSFTEEQDSEPTFDSLQLIFNLDNKQVVYRDDMDTEYELSEPDDEGVVYVGEGEGNPGSGDEESCLYDASTVIKLVKGQNADGEEVPALNIHIEEADCYDENYSESYDYTLTWSEEIPDAVPYYLNAEAPDALASVIKSCEEIAKDGEYYNPSSLCGWTMNFKIRDDVDASVAVADLLDYYSDSDADEASFDDLQEKVFDKLEEKIQKFKKDDFNGSKKDLKEKVKAVTDYLVDNSIPNYFLKISEFGSVDIYTVNEETQMLTVFHFDID